MTDEDGRCRFNCRTQREAWLAAIEFYERYADEHDCVCPDERAVLAGYRQWRREQNESG